MTVFITKYALTRGIIEAEVSSRVNGRMVLVTFPGDRSKSAFTGNEWHATKEAAVIQAEKMRVHKIGQLEQQIAKLRQLTFGGSE